LTENGANFFAGKPGPYMLGYRTDRTACNVESVSWKHMNQAAGAAGYQGNTRYTEDGANPDFKNLKISALGQTWVMKPKYAKQADPAKLKAYVFEAMKGTLAMQGYQVLRHFYTQLPYSKMKPSDLDHVSSGFEITILLNEGDPYLRPPRSAKLYAGSLNPRADSSYLPQWIYRHSSGYAEPADLKINQTELFYDHGILKSKLTCSISMYPEGT